MNVICQAEQVGNLYRGLVIDAKTYVTISVTAHNYANETIARCAAKRMYEESVQVAA